MNVFELRDTVVREYSSYISSFLRIKDPRIDTFVNDQLSSGYLWPDPLVQLNPSFESAGTVEDVVAQGLLTPECRRIFRRDKKQGPGTSLRLHRHQQDAIEVARGGGSYVLTTGTGSGKSLSYFIPIIDDILRRGAGQGIKAIIVYPMNALCNSQMAELERYLGDGYPDGGRPVRFKRYTGQESEQERKDIAERPPDILLTNYMMLELLLTRMDTNGQHVIEAAQGLEFLVLDELHTYRGRQGADVSMLVRRVRERCGAPTMRCVGTSATMAGGGTREERAAVVADIASLLFGDHVPPENVIGETLRQAVTRLDPTVDELRDALAGEPAYTTDYDTLTSEPLAAWAEMAFGLRRDEKGRLERRQPASAKAVATRLAEETGVDLVRCQLHLQALLLAGFKATHPTTDVPLFAFRLHQFISRGDSVYATIEHPDSRFLSMEEQVYVPGDRGRRLYPLAFCRECGEAYYVIDRPAGRPLEKRWLTAISNDSKEPSGFILADPDQHFDPADVESLPEDWLEQRRDGTVRVRAGSKDWMPRVVYVGPDGSWSETQGEGGMRCVFMPAPFRFCPHCQVSYTSSTRSDFGKLAALATEGRSTATTILSLTIIRALREADDVKNEARKLLSFTDNRQDASLQAGHFNDFIQVGLLRAALYAAVKDAGASGLTHETIAHAVTDKLALTFDEYSTNADARFDARKRIEQALRDAIGYRIYRDQERGWRVTTPNLEQVGLLHVDYSSLDELCAADDVWQTRHPLLAAATHEERERACRAVLDTLRRELAIKVSYLDQEQQEKLMQTSFSYLKEPWSIEEDTLRAAPVAWIGPRERGSSRVDLTISGTSALGQYLRRPRTWPSSLQAGKKLAVAELETLARDLCDALVIGGQLEPTEERKDGVRAYRVQAGCMRWIAGDGTPPPPDAVRITRATTEPKETNKFFRDFYETTALALGDLEAREHTAQVPAKEREERESRFRDGLLPVLYCSPTMELGVDISDLSAVNMRNVPPTPANYAQRSGRAGRQGQPALVLTYCSSNSPHDQYFFRRRELMVSGQVSTPRLDLANEDLVRAHFHAVWLAETGQSLGTSLRHLIDLETGADLHLQTGISDSLRSPHARRRAMVRCESILANMDDDLSGATWYGPGWLQSVIDGAYRAFDQACDRWRALYRSACLQRDRQHAIIVDASVSPDSRETAQRLRNEAETQIKLLIDEVEVQSDFSSYRYFASEGFLPGYNFPRLPLAAYLPGRRRNTGRDEFVSRPRFLAVSEFGPGALIYHEGSQYRVERVLMSVQESGERTTTAKICGRCGYGHLGDTSGQERCRYCDGLLNGEGHVKYFTNLLRLDNVATRRVERITSDEEERVRRGYRMKTALRFAETVDGLSCTHAIVSDATGEVARMTYAPTATLWRLNLGWIRRKEDAPDGFSLDMETGKWSKSERVVVDVNGEQADDAAARMIRVVPFVEDRRNALVVQLYDTGDAVVQASLQYAVKRGIEAVYQIEDRELAVEPLPDVSDRRLILFYESSEGGAGVLSRLAQEPDALARVARKALEICHFVVDVTEDPQPAAVDPCEAACYACLLSYTNQREHSMLDRHAVKNILEQLAGTTTAAGSGQRDRPSALTGLLAGCASGLERDFVHYLDAGGYRLPDYAGAVVQGYETRPDFYYDGEMQTCVYIDGPVHDYAERRERDAAHTRRLENGGYTVIRVEGPETWDAAMRAYSWVFGPGKEVKETEGVMA